MQRRYIDYAFAILIVVLATVLRLSLNSVFGRDIPFAVHYFAVLVAAWIGGLRPALLTLGLSALAVDFYFLQPTGSLWLDLPQERYGLEFFLVTGLGTSLLAGRMHSALRKLEATLVEYRQKQLILDDAYAHLEACIHKRSLELISANDSHMQSQKLLQASETRFRSYFENAPIGILIADDKRCFKEANPEALRMLGYSAEELRGQPIGAIQATLKHDELQKELDELKNIGAYDRPRLLARQDGTQFLAALRAVMLPQDRSMAFFRDITEEHRASEALRNERDWFAYVMATIPVVICSFREFPNGKWTSALANPRLEPLLGVSAASIAKDATVLFEHVHPDDVVSLRLSATEAARGLHPWHYEYRLINPARGELWIEANFVATHEPGGSTLWNGYLADITSRKRTEDSLKTSEARLSQLLEGVTDYAIFMMNPAGLIMTWQKGAQQMYGYADDDILGQPYSCLFPPQRTAEGTPANELARASANGDCDTEGWRSRKNGTQFWTTGSLTALYNGAGNVIGYAQVSRDITIKRRNDELLHSVLDHTLDGIITINEHGILSTINKAGEDLFGYRSNEILGENVRQLMPESDSSRHDSYITNYVNTHEAKIIGIGREVRGQRKDGSTFPMDLAITEFRLDEQRYFVGIVRDVSEKKKLQAQLFQSQKMEAFGQLAGGVAHDFNNLLTLINGYSQMLQRMVPATDGKQKMLGQIFRAGQRAASLTQQLLAFSRQQVLESKLLDVNTVVLDAEVLLRRLIGEDIDLTTTLSTHLSAIKADPGQIEQVIVNLALNARDAMPQGGKLTIETSELEIGEPPSGQAKPERYVTISISDTGVGILPELQERIFEPFFTTKSVGKGTGLGLAVAHGIIKQSGGTIDLYSEVGVGTTLKIRLPAVGSSAPKPAEQNLPPSGAGRETLLLVEDDDNVREFVALSLESFGYTIVTAPDGKAALSLYLNRDSPIDLVITDVVMPEMSGRVLAEMLLASNPGQKVLFLSGYTDDAVVRHGILQANVAFLQKPFTPEALSRKVREVIDQA